VIEDCHDNPEAEQRCPYLRTKPAAVVGSARSLANRHSFIAQGKPRRLGGRSPWTLTDERSASARSVGSARRSQQHNNWLRFAGSRSMHTHSVPFALAPSQLIAGVVIRIRRRARRHSLRLTKFMTLCADYYSARVQYEELSRLSHYELWRRDMTQGDVHRHVSLQ
jgi:hypothetical protein